MDGAYHLLAENLLSPIVIAFLIGMAATFVKSELEFPQPVLNAISIYLVFSIALKGGTELAAAGWVAIWKPAMAAVLVAVLLPVWIFFITRKLLRLDVSNAAGLAALYGSVSSVTFLAAISFTAKLGNPAEPFLPLLVSVMEWAILVALLCARVGLQKSNKGTLDFREAIIDTLRSRSVILLVGGMVMGYVIGEKGFQPIKPVFEDAFRGVLVLFLLEMGMVAARQFRDFVKLGPRIIAWGIFAPIVHGIAGLTIGHWAGLGLGGSFVFGAITASSSYIDAPAAVRAALPDANPGIYLTSSLGITFPFNLLLGLPIYYSYAVWLCGK